MGFFSLHSEKRERREKKRLEMKRERETNDGQKDGGIRRILGNRRKKKSDLGWVFVNHNNDEVEKKGKQESAGYDSIQQKWEHARLRFPIFIGSRKTSSTHYRRPLPLLTAETKKKDDMHRY